MTDDEKLSLRTAAKLDGIAAIAENCGEKVSISEIDMLVLANLAHIGLWSILSSAETTSSKKAEEILDTIIRDAREFFSANGPNGIQKLCENGMAIIHSERILKFLAYKGPER